MKNSKPKMLVRWLPWNIYIFAGLRLLWVVDCVMTLVSRCRMRGQKGPRKGTCPMRWKLATIVPVFHFHGLSVLEPTKSNIAAAGIGWKKMPLCPRTSSPTWVRSSMGNSGSWLYLMPVAPIILLANPSMQMGGSVQLLPQTSFSKVNGQSFPVSFISFVQNYLCKPL